MAKQDLEKAAAHAKAHIAVGEGWELVQAEGAVPFVSHIVHRRPDGSLHHWTSRRHRKSRCLVRKIAATEQRAGLRVHLWSPSKLGWWISVLFMIGASCFALGSFAGLAPNLVGEFLQRLAVLNAVFFIGSLFFTSAAYLQLLEAANSTRRAAQRRGESPARPFSWFGWQPQQIGWLSAAIQFVGTLLFNMNTADAMLPGLSWLQYDRLIWAPDVFGSICFLIASWLAVLECCHGLPDLKIRGLSWWIVMINMLGSVGFGIAAVFAINLPNAAGLLNLWAVNFWTLVGALCFLVGAYLLLPEMIRHEVL